MAGEVTVARFVLFEQVAPGCEDLPSDLNSGADLYFFETNMVHTFLLNHFAKMACDE